jgi:glycosyltransferase involved in cell wall biosynthesis
MARICVIRQGYYTLDPRVRREVQALTTAGHQVDVITLRRPGERGLDQEGDVTVHRVWLPGGRRGQFWYLVQYGLFFVIAAAMAAWLHLRRRFDLVQVNSMPDSLVFAAFIPRLLGARVLLDLQECMPEFYMVKFGTEAGHPLVRLVAWVEQAAIRFADAAITCTDQMAGALFSRGAARDKVAVIVNGSDEDIFDPTHAEAAPRAEEFRLISHGTLEYRYGLDTIVRAVALLRDEIPGLRLDLIGEGTALEELRSLVQELGVEDRVFVPGHFVPMADLVQAIAAADAGVVAIRRDAFRDLTLCNKMFDFIAMRKPAIVSRTHSVDVYFGDSCFAMFTDGDAQDLARAIRDVHRDPDLRDRLIRQSTTTAEPYRWPAQRERYLQIVQALIEAHPRRRPESHPLGEGVRSLR